ncbi:MAG: cupredoxin domain-containing protein [Candidatus Competibacteraceae bacterium]|nr:cupredoxin domain-containing protein [Candidatus Competibacteraceae bacterium]
MSLSIKALVVVATLSFSTSALTDAGHADIGKPGKTPAAQRTVEITLGEMYFKPETLNVKAGETVRFVVKNEGQLLHEFNIGTSDMHAHHREEMAMMMEHGMLTPTGINPERMNMDHGQMGMGSMKHDDPNSVLVEPGKTMELVWTFPKSGALQVACNIPGHSEAGMVGQIAIGR